jgi:hypothetical protein
MATNALQLHGGIQLLLNKCFFFSFKVYMVKGCHYICKYIRLKENVYFLFCSIRIALFPSVQLKKQFVVAC